MNERIQTRVVIAGEPLLIDGANRIATLRVQARDLQRGGCVGSGETVVSVSAGFFSRACASLNITRPIA
jgi:hypothetical protein